MDVDTVITNTLHHHTQPYTQYIVHSNIVNTYGYGYGGILTKMASFESTKPNLTLFKENCFQIEKDLQTLQPIF